MITDILKKSARVKNPNGDKIIGNKQALSFMTVKPEYTDPTLSTSYKYVNPEEPTSYGISRISSDGKSMQNIDADADEYKAMLFAPPSNPDDILNQEQTNNDVNQTLAYIPDPVVQERQAPQQQVETINPAQQQTVPNYKHIFGKGFNENGVDPETKWLVQQAKLLSDQGYSEGQISMMLDSKAYRKYGRKNQQYVVNKRRFTRPLNKRANWNSLHYLMQFI